MQSFTVPVVLLSLLQGCAYPQPPISMSDSPVPACSGLSTTSVDSTSGRLQMVEFKLSDYQWQHRTVLIFAPSKRIPVYQQQVQMWQADRANVNERDLKLVEVLGTGESRVDGKFLSAASVERLRQQFGVPVEEFAVILIGKDGTEKQRSQTPVDVAVLFRTIDAMPMRQQEMRSRQ